MRYLILALLLMASPAFAEDTYRIQVLTKDFVPELGHDYADAQYLDVPASMTLDEVKGVYGASVSIEKEKRIAARIHEKQNPPTPVEPTKADWLASKASLELQIAEVNAKIAEIDKKPK